ncbi:MAG TPA: tetratricopeptide repeat protein [Pyrinomonadaceae bacterium]|nr:tetratricopeptide repeat protein [Pyrinomonadaceae bacterium]
MKKLFGISIIVFLSAFAIAAHDGLHEQILAVTEAIKKDPQNAALYLKRAELYRLHAEWKLSENDFDRAEKLDGNLASINLGRGKLGLDTKQFSKAKRALEKFLRREPESFEGILTMARVCAKLGQTGAAVRYFTKAIALAPEDSAEIYLERAETSVSANRIDEALRGLDEGIEKLGNLVTLQTAAIDLEVRRRNYDAALARLDKLTAVMERKESFHLRRGEILYQAKRNCEARKSLLQAQEIYNSLTDFRKKVRAVKEQIARLEKLLKTIPAKSCQ